MTHTILNFLGYLMRRWYKMLRFLEIETILDLYHPKYPSYIVGSNERKYLAYKKRLEELTTEEYLNCVANNNDPLLLIYNLEQQILENGFWNTARQNLKNKNSISHLTKEEIEVMLGVTILMASDAIKYKDKFYPVPEELFYAKEIQEIIRFLTYLIKDINMFMLI